MPELPEVEVTCQTLRHLILDSQIQHIKVRTPSLRTPIPSSFSQQITNQSIIQIKRIGKYFILSLDNGWDILGHLGMSGSFRFTPHSSTPFIPQKHDHVLFTFPHGILAYHDPRRFGFLDLKHDATSYLDQKLGYDPFDITPQQFETILTPKKTSIKSALFNQKNITGLGNIYICEMLFASSISPFRLCSHISSQEYHRLHGHMQTILKEAIAQGGSTLKDFQNPEQKTGYFQRQHLVYQQAGTPCKKHDCSGVIVREIQNNRSSFYCPHHQK